MVDHNPFWDNSKSLWGIRPRKCNYLLQWLKGKSLCCLGVTGLRNAGKLLGLVHHLCIKCLLWRISLLSMKPSLRRGIDTSGLIKPPFRCTAHLPESKTRAICSYRKGRAGASKTYLQRDWKDWAATVVLVAKRKMVHWECVAMCVLISTRTYLIQKICLLR